MFNSNIVGSGSGSGNGISLAVRHIRHIRLLD